MSDELPDTVPQLRAAARRTGGYSRSVPHAEVREAVVHIDEQAKEIATLRRQLAEARGETEKLRAGFIKALRERPVAPHPIDQMANMTRFLAADAEAECAALRARVETLEAALGELVALKALKDGGAEAMRGGNYDARKPKAWASARTALAGKE